MFSCEVCIDLANKDYLEELILGLVMQGYEVYYNEELNKLCYIERERENVTVTRE